MRFLFFLSILSLLLWAKGPDSTTFSNKSLRVVALSPSYCETMEALNLGHLLVGVSSHCQELKYKNIPKVGSFAEPNFEAIMALKPDLVLAIPHLMAKNVLDLLLENDIEIFAMQADSLADIFLITKKLAQKLGQAEKGDQVVSEIKLALSKAQSEAKNLRQASFLMALSPAPLIVAGKRTFSSEVLEALGLKNLADNEISWPIWPLESLLKKPPELFIVPDGPDMWPNYENLLLNLGLKIINIEKGSQKDSLKVVVPHYPILSSPSPKIIDDIAHISEILKNNHE